MEAGTPSLAQGPSDLLPNWECRSSLPRRGVGPPSYSGPEARAVKGAVQASCIHGSLICFYPSLLFSS